MQDVVKAGINSQPNSLGDFSLGHHRHICKQSHFDLVFAAKQKSENRFVRLFFSPALGAPKVAFIASKKVGSAVKRNRAKRLMKEIYRLSQHNIPPLDIIMSAKHNLTTATFAQAQAAIAPLLTRLST